MSPRNYVSEPFCRSPDWQLNQVQIEQASQARLLKKREVQTWITDLCISIKIQQHINSDKTVAKGQFWRISGRKEKNQNL